MVNLTIIEKGGPVVLARSPKKQKTTNLRGARKAHTKKKTGREGKENGSALNHWVLLGFGIKKESGKTGSKKGSKQHDHAMWKKKDVS